MLRCLLEAVDALLQVTSYALFPRNAHPSLAGGGAQPQRRDAERVPQARGRPRVAVCARSPPAPRAGASNAFHCECRCEALQQRVGKGKDSKQEQAYVQVQPPTFKTEMAYCVACDVGQMEQELREGDEKVQCKAASACWKVAYSDPDCRNTLGLVLLPYTSHLTPHTLHLTPHP